jgi:hypothetical protein
MEALKLIYKKKGSKYLFGNNQKVIKTQWNGKMKGCFHDNLENILRSNLIKNLIIWI